MYKSKKKKLIAANKKIANATKTTVNGVAYRSKLEAFTANILNREGIKYEYEKNKFILQDKFTFPNESIEEFKKKKVGKQFAAINNNIQHISYTPDFVDEKFRWIIECKGMKTDAFTLKWKMFKKYIKDNDLKIDLYLPKNQTQVLDVINKIKNKYK